MAQKFRVPLAVKNERGINADSVELADVVAINKATGVEGRVWASKILDNLSARVALLEG